MKHSLVLLILCLCVALSAPGCAHKKFSETLTETQDDGTPITTKTTDSSWVFHIPFGKEGPSAANLTYTWGGKGPNKIVSGQKISDVDSTNQTVALQAFTGMVGDIVAKVLESYLTAQTGGASAAVSAGTTGGSALNKITTLTELLRQLQSLGLLKGQLPP